MEAVFSLNPPDTPVVPGGPCCFGRMAEVGCFRIMREVVISLSLAGSVCIDDGNAVVTLRPPVSKTDPSALRCSRRAAFGCACHAGTGHHAPRPLFL